MVYCVTPDEVLRIGFGIIGDRDSLKRTRMMQIRRFKSLYGSNPIVYSVLWENLQTTDIEEAKITPKNKEDLEKFLMSIYWLKTNDTEAKIVSRFRFKDEKTVRKWCWFYAKKIQALLPEVVYWPEEWNDENVDLPTFLISVDGTHCRVEEPMHPSWSKNPQYYSHKFKKAALNYEIALSVFENRVVWVNGPYPGATNDITSKCMMQNCVCFIYCF